MGEPWYNARYGQPATAGERAGGLAARHRRAGGPGRPVGRRWRMSHERLLRTLAADVVANPAAYRDAAAWLDERYGPGKVFDGKRPVGELPRFQRAVFETVEELTPQRVLSKVEAQRVALVAALVAAERLPEGLSSFANTPFTVESPSWMVRALNGRQERLRFLSDGLWGQFIALAKRARDVLLPAEARRDLPPSFGKAGVVREAAEALGADQATKGAGAGAVGEAPHAVSSERMREFLKRFQKLAAEPDHKKRGLMFETFLNGFFHAHGLAPRGSFRVKGTQIDGSFEWDGDTYKVEARWRKSRADAADLQVLRGKAETSAWTRGLFISMSGFSPMASETHRMSRTVNVIGMSGDDLVLILDGQCTLDDALRAKRRHVGETGEAYLPLAKATKAVGSEQLRRGT